MEWHVEEHTLFCVCVRSLSGRVGFVRFVNT